MLLHKDTFILDKRELGTLARLASNDPDRESLTAVWFDRGVDGRGRVWACDGHSAAIVDNDGGSKAAQPRGLLAVDLALAAKQSRTRDLIAIRPGHANGQRARRPRWAVLPGTGYKPGELLEAVRQGEAPDPAVSGNAALVDLPPSPIDQVFPRWDISPPAKTAGGAKYNPSKLAPFLADAGRLIGDMRSVKFYFAGELDPVLLIFKDAERGTVWRYCLMPMRT